LNGETFNVDVDPDNKVKTIKESIKGIKQVESTVYTLKKGNEVLDDNKSIFDSGIKAGTVLTVDYNTITVMVSIDGKEV
jgi:hypothetical protein